jgi:hypothetical protein
VTLLRKMYQQNLCIPFLLCGGPEATAPSLQPGPAPKIYHNKYHSTIFVQCVILFLFQSYLHQNLICIYCLTHSSLHVQLPYPPRFRYPKISILSNRYKLQICSSVRIQISIFLHFS